MKWFFTWEGRVRRFPYFLSGTLLVLIKYTIDWFVAARFGESWRIWNYFFPGDATVFRLGERQPELYGILWAIAIPFFWIGIALTMRRLRDAGQATWWIFLFFVPILNLAMFLCLTLAPSNSAGRQDVYRTRETTKTARSHGIAIGIVVAVALGFVMAILATRVFMDYGWGLFLGVPFLIGFISSWFLNFRAPHTRWQTIQVSSLTTLLLGLTLLGFGAEGLVCLLMAIPLALPFSIAGGMVAWCILWRGDRNLAPSTLASLLVILPVSMVAEHNAKLEPPVFSVTTSVIIDAAPSTVWRHVVAFTPLPAPTEMLFRAGIAYPTSAQIIGSGRGAVRYCRFSTGDFVEPITIWDENRLLAFDVLAEPPAMQELSPWNITPPHVEHNYMRSLKGQFRLIALSDHRTLLEGTTWYQNYFWPQPYWQAWSDGIVHRIHLRVLQHVKRQAEASQ